MKRMLRSLVIGAFILISVPAPHSAWARDEASANTSFSFAQSGHEDIKTLQQSLENQFPLGTPQEKVDSLLVGQAGAVRSVNLIANFAGNKFLSAGSSSADNFVLYFKTADDVKGNLWESDVSGWVIMGTYDNGKALKGLEVRATPKMQRSDLAEDAIASAKEYLQYSHDIQPVVDFDDMEWAALVQAHSDFPCKEKLSLDCIISAARQLVGYPDRFTRRAYMGEFAEITIAQNDIAMARALLKVWPTPQDIIAANEKIPRMRRPKVDYFLAINEQRKMRLLFVAGEFEAAKKMLLSLHAQYKTGDDYGAIRALLQTGNLAAAFDIAKLTHDWRRGTPDPWENTSAIMHCENYMATRPVVIGDLISTYVDAGNFDRADDLLTRLRDYIDNKSFGQSSHCYLSAARRAYQEGQKAIFKARMAKGDRAQAEAAFASLKSVLLKAPSPLTVHNIRAYEGLALLAAKHGLKEEAKEIAEYVLANAQIDYRKGYTQANSFAVMYALAGNVEKALNDIEAESYEQKKLPAESLLDPLAVMLSERSTADEIKLDSYMHIARVMTDLGDKDSAIKSLDRATIYFGTRTPKYDRAVENLEDYIHKANILFTLGEKEKSRIVTESLLEAFAKTSVEDYRGGEITKSFYGSFAELLAKHKDMVFVQAWADKLPTYYSGYRYGQIGKWLVEQNRWAELDAYMPEMARVLSTDVQPLQNWVAFWSALIAAGDFDRYMTFLDLLNEGTGETHKRQGTNRAWPRERYGSIETDDTRAQVEMMRHLFFSSLSGKRVPTEILEKAWPRYINSCRVSYYKLPRDAENQNRSENAKEVMAGCYLSVYRGHQYFQDTQRREKSHAN